MMFLIPPMKPTPGRSRDQIAIIKGKPMSELTEPQKSTLERVKAANGAVVLPVAAARKLVALGLIKHDGTTGHVKAKAAYVLV